MYIVESNGEKSFINPKLLEMVTLSIEEYGCEYDFLEWNKNFWKVLEYYVFFIKKYGMQSGV